MPACLSLPALIVPGQGLKSDTRDNCAVPGTDAKSHAPARASPVVEAVHRAAAGAAALVGAIRLPLRGGRRDCRGLRERRCGRRRLLQQLLQQLVVSRQGRLRRQCCSASGDSSEL